MVKTPLTMEYALLGFLQEEPMHAYEMHHQLHSAEALGLVWRIKQSQLYALLARLEEVGYLTTVTAPQETRPARKMLYLTEAGRAAFEEWRETPVYHGRELRQADLALPRTKRIRLDPGEIEFFVRQLHRMIIASP